MKWIQLPSGRYLNLAIVAGVVTEGKQFARIDYACGDGQHGLGSEFVTGPDADALIAAVRGLCEPTPEGQ